MTKKITGLLSFFLLFLSSAYGQSNRIDVYLGMSDCISCYSNLNALNVMTNYDRNIIISRTDSLVAAELLADFQLSNVHFKYISTLQTTQSYYKIFPKGVFTDSLALFLLPSKAASYALQDKPQSDPNLKPFYLPANTAFNNDRLDMMFRNSKIMIYDYILNKAIVFNAESGKDTLKKLIEIKGSQFPNRPFLIASKIDTVLYNNCAPLFKSMGKHHPHIEGAYLSDSCLFLFLNFPYAIIEETPAHTPDTAITFKYFIYERNFITGTKKLSFINDSAIKKKYKGEYGVSNVFPFYIDSKNRQLVTSVIDYTDEKKPVPIFFKTIYKNNVYEATELDNLFFERDYYSKNLLERYKIWVNSRYYYNVKYNLLVDYKQHKILYLKNISMSNVLWGRDIMEEKDYLKLLILAGEQNKEYLETIYYDPKQQKVISNEKHDLPKDCSKGTIRFYDASTVFFMSLDKPKGYFLKIDK